MKWDEALATLLFCFMCGSIFFMCSMTQENIRKDHGYYDENLKLVPLRKLNRCEERLQIRPLCVLGGSPTCVCEPDIPFDHCSWRCIDTTETAKGKWP